MSGSRGTVSVRSCAAPRPARPRHGLGRGARAGGALPSSTRIARQAARPGGGSPQERFAAYPPAAAPRREHGQLPRARAEQHPRDDASRRAAGPPSVSVVCASVLVPQPRRSPKAQADHGRRRGTRGQAPRLGARTASRSRGGCTRPAPACLDYAGAAVGSQAERQRAPVAQWSTVLFGEPKSSGLSSRRPRVRFPPGASLSRRALPGAGGEPDAPRSRRAPPPPFARGAGWHGPFDARYTLRRDCHKSTDRFKLTFCVNRDLYVR